MVVNVLKCTIRNSRKTRILWTFPVSFLGKMVLEDYQVMGRFVFTPLFPGNEVNTQGSPIFAGEAFHSSSSFFSQEKFS